MVKKSKNIDDMVYDIKKKPLNNKKTIIAIVLACIFLIYCIYLLIRLLINPTDTFIVEKGKIYKEESNIVELRDGIKYLDKAKLTETPNEYEYIIQKDYYEANTLAVDDVICIGDGTNNITDDCLFVKIIDSIKDEKA